MNRILDYNPDPEDDVVGRILLVVHRAIDENFPSAKDPSRSFTKTLFSETKGGGEETKIERTKVDLSDEGTDQRKTPRTQPSPKLPKTKEAPKKSDLKSPYGSAVEELEYSQVASMSEPLRKTSSSRRGFWLFVFILVLLAAAYFWFQP